MLWDLIQHCQITGEAKERQQETAELLDRVRHLEDDLRRTRAQLRKLTEVLESRFGEDLNGDGAIGN